MTPRETTTPLRSLGRGLAVLQQLASADGPLSATEIAQRCGMHQTSASRILADLVTAGYARRISSREYSPDIGLLALGLEASRHFPLLTRPRWAMEHAARLCAGLTLSLCTRWRGRLIYFDQTTPGSETRMFSSDDYPLHLSSPGLLFVLELPETQAIAALEASRATFGWSQPTSSVPPSAAGLLAAARRQRQHGSLVLARWAGPDHISAAVRLPDQDGSPLALAVAGSISLVSESSIRLRLQEARRVVESTLTR